MIVVTGGAGFIGYNLVKRLIETGHEDVVVVDNNIGRIVERKHQNITYLSVEDSYMWLGFNGNAIKSVYHLGARTDTMETNTELLKYLNTNYSKFIWNFCTDFKIPLIYASSAAVYGDGELGFSEDLEPERLNPLNEYGWSKLDFDHYALGNSNGDAVYCVDGKKNAPPHWFGFRFFNVYGQHEDHKGKMASVIWHLYNQIRETGEAKLFKSHRDDYMHGYQMRDFISVNDVINVMSLTHQIRHAMPSGIYNLGTGKPRTYNDLALAIFKSLGLPVNISYIDTPREIRDSYQYFTGADMTRLIHAMGGYDFMTLETGIDIYIKQLQYENR